MVYLVIGVLGIIVAGFISRSLHAYAVEARRIDPSKPFGGAIPGWVSLLYLLSFVCALYGLYRAVF